MIKILYVVDSLKQRFGVTNFILNYICNSKSESISYTVLAYENSEIEIIERLKRVGCAVYTMPILSLKNIISFNKWMNLFFQQHRFDIVHSHFNQIERPLFKNAKKEGVKICISHSHSTRLSVNKIKNLRNRIMRFGCNKMADYWAACSMSAGIAMFGKQFCDNPKKIIINNAIDSKKFLFSLEKRETLRKQYAILDDYIVIGHTGSFKEEKNHLFILRCFQKIVSYNDNFRLMLIGDGPLKKEVENYAKKIDLFNRVFFIGAVDNVNDYLCAMDIYLLPSLFEGLGISAIEAQNCGLPCLVSTNVPDETKISQNITYLPIKNSEQVWADKIINMQKVERNSKINLALEHGFDISNEVLKLESFYLTICRQKEETNKK